MADRGYTEDDLADNRHVQGPPPTTTKSKAAVETEYVSTREKTFDSKSSKDISWETGVWKRFPWAAFGAFWIVVLCTIATILVLKFSDNTPSQDFCSGKLGPNVFLTIFNNISNLAITFAVAQGIAIAWWRRALSGQTVKELHYSWSFSHSISHVFLNFRYFNIIALAALATKIAVVDSVCKCYDHNLKKATDIKCIPVYQMSLEPYTGRWDNPNKEQFHNFFTATVFPVTGALGSTSTTGGSISAEMDMYTNYWAQEGGATTRYLDMSQCNGTECRIAVPAAGWSVDCVNNQDKIDYGTTAAMALSQNNVSGYQNLPYFGVNFLLNWPSPSKNYSSITMNATWAMPLQANVTHGGSCLMGLNRTLCELRPAVINYTIVMTNQDSETIGNQKRKISTLGYKHTKYGDASDPGDFYKIDLASYSQTIPGCDPQTNPACGWYKPDVRQVVGFDVLEQRDVIEHWSPGANSTMTGFYIAFVEAFTASATATYNGSYWFHAQQGKMEAYARDYDDNSGTCLARYWDPIPNIVTQINLLSLMVATDSTAYLPWHNSYNISNPNSQPNASAWSDWDHPYNNISPSLLHNMTIPATVVYVDIIYHTNWTYVWVALAVTIAIILMILPVYWRFWELGRKVTLGPFEIANAFQSPALAGARATAGHADEVLKAIGTNKMRYGQVVDANGRRFVFHEV